MKPRQFCMFCDTWREVIRTWAEVFILWILLTVAIFISLYYYAFTGLVISPIFGWDFNGPYEQG